MIYLIETTYLIEETNTPLKLLKIGYTSDQSWNSRYQAYKLHNPCCKVLFRIPNATDKYERCLHIYFSDLRFPGYGREWYYWDKKIISFFEQNRTSEQLVISLNNIKGEGEEGYIAEEFINISSKVVRYLQNIGKLSKENIRLSLSTFNSIVSSLRKIDRPNNIKVWGFIEKEFNVDRKSVYSFWEEKLAEFESLGENISKQVNVFMDKFNSTRTFIEGMKLLCNEENLTKQVLDIINFLLPIDYSAYYLTLGSEKIKALGCQKSRLRREYDKVTNNSQITKQEIQQAFYKEFRVGERIAIRDVKLRVQKIYSSIGLEKTGKAVNILEYFEVMRTKVKDKVTGKFIDGYEILKIKQL